MDIPGNVCPSVPADRLAVGTKLGTVELARVGASEVLGPSETFRDGQGWEGYETRHDTHHSGHSSGPR